MVATKLVKEKYDAAFIEHDKISRCVWHDGNL